MNIVDTSMFKGPVIRPLSNKIKTKYTLNDLNLYGQLIQSRNESRLGRMCR